MNIEDNTRVVLRPIANPLPLGFLALAGGTLVVSGLQLGWLEPTEGHNVALILLAFVFPLQLVTSVFGYLGRDVVAGTGMASGTWKDIAGLVGLLPCAIGVYAALALALEDTRGETVLPLGRRNRGSMQGTFASQVAGVEREAGVREQL